MSYNICAYYYCDACHDKGDHFPADQCARCRITELEAEVSSLRATIAELERGVVIISPPAGHAPPP